MKIKLLELQKLPDNDAMEPVIAEIARAVRDYFVFNRGDA